MTPKEKALELVNKYYNLLNPNFPITDVLFKDCCKCVLIAVKEIINIVPYEDNDKAKWISYEQTIRYWKEVEQEIINL
jgi:hypothetical protein